MINDWRPRASLFLACRGRFTPATETPRIPGRLKRIYGDKVFQGDVVTDERDFDPIELRRAAGRSRPGPPLGVKAGLRQKAMPRSEQRPAA